MTLKELKKGESGVVTTVGGQGALRQHFLDMGVIPGAEVTLVKYAPMGDPIEIRIHGYELTMRKADASQIDITTKGLDSAPETDATEDDYLTTVAEIPHPGLGEGGRYHEEQTAGQGMRGVCNTPSNSIVVSPFFHKFPFLLLPPSQDHPCGLQKESRFFSTYLYRVH